MELSDQLHATPTHWIGGWVGPRPGQDIVKERMKSPAPIWDRTPIPWFSNLQLSPYAD
jgi:hypothetical protein